MKVRNDYVTNSSSSSYIIAFNNDAVHQADKAYKRMIDALIDCENDDETRRGRIIVGKEAWDEYFLYYYGYGQDSIEKLLEDEGEYLSNKYNAISEKVSQGFAILVKSIDYSDEGLSNFITLLGDNNDDFIILEDAG